jgi:ubiquinone/menaquinone biosynthesis C-methylase UbiE
MQFERKAKSDLIFAGKIAQAYDGWFQTYQGKYAERLESDLIMRLATLKQGARVLDVGCGTGNHLLLFASHGMTFGSGVDISVEMLEIAKGKMGERLGKDRSLVLGRAEVLPYKEGAYDLVTLITSLEFFTNPGVAIREALRVSRGHALIAVLNRWSLSALQRRLRSFLRRSVFESITFYSPWKLARVIREAVPKDKKVKISWRSTLLTFPWVPRILTRPIERMDRWSSRHRCHFGAFLVMRVELEN